MRKQKMKGYVIIRFVLNSNNFGDFNEPVSGFVHVFHGRISFPSLFARLRTETTEYRP